MTTKLWMSRSDFNELGNNNNNTSTGSSPLLPSSLPGTPVPNPLGAQDLAKSYLASLSKFPSLFPLAVPPPTRAARQDSEKQVRQTGIEQMEH